jgi:hypothetical protein
MTKSIEQRLKELEKRVKRLDEAIPKEMQCPTCHRLLTIHEEYSNVAKYYKGTSHAQCYHCLEYGDVEEEKQRKINWKYRPKNWPKLIKI